VSPLLPAGPLLLALTLTLVSACVSDPIGDEVGTYRVTMSLASNTCGASAVYLRDGHRYTAQLRVAGDEGFWRISGQQPMSGTYEAGEFKFAYSSLVAKSAPDAGVVCQLVQEEELVGVVALSDEMNDAGVADASMAKSSGESDDESEEEDESYEPPEEGLVGRHVFRIKAANGTDCSAALMPKGAFERLPCTVRYELEGSPTKSF
jgi:hypothetical protein